MSKSENQVFDFEKICRLCLGEKRSMSAIFTKKKSDKKVPLPVRIMSCASLELFEGDGMPTSICNKCLVTVNASYAFREQCEQADTTLRRYAAQQQEKEGKVEELDEQPQEQEYEEEDDEEQEDMQQEEAEQGDSEDQTEPSPSTEDANTVYGISSDSDDSSNGGFDDDSDYEPLWTKRNRIINTTPPKKLMTPLTKKTMKEEATNKITETPNKKEDMLKNLFENSEITITKQTLNTKLSPTKRPPPKSSVSYRKIPQSKTGLIATCLKLGPDIVVTEKGRNNAIKTSKEGAKIPKNNTALRKIKAIERYKLTNVFRNRPSWSQLEIAAVSAYKRAQLRDREMAKMQKPEKNVVKVNSKRTVEQSKHEKSKKKNVIWKRAVRSQNSKPPKVFPYADKFSDLGDGKMVCLICNSVVKRAGISSHYSFVHDKSVVGVCDICGAEFNRKEKLKRHLMQHNPEKPFACAICQYKFHLKGQLKRHMKRHSDERPHICSCCGKAFKLNSHLRFHEEHKHNIMNRVFTCGTCEQGFNVWGKYQRHVEGCTGISLDERRRTRKPHFTIQDLAKLAPNKF